MKKPDIPLNVRVAGNDQRQPLTGHQLLANLLQGWRIIAWMTCSGVLLAALYLCVAVPQYSSQSVIQVEERKGHSLMGAMDQAWSWIFSQASSVATEMEVVRSRSVLQEAIKNLSLHVEVSVDEPFPSIGAWFSRLLGLDAKSPKGRLFAKSSVADEVTGLWFQSIEVPQAVVGQALELKVESHDRWQLTVVDTNELVASGEGLVTQFAQDRVQVALGRLRARPGTRFRVVVQSVPSTVQRIQARLVVREARRQSNLIALNYQSSVPEAAHATLAAIVDAYLRQNIARRAEEMRLTLDLLKVELPRVQDALESSEQALNAFRHQVGSIDMAGELQSLSTLAGELESQRVALVLKQAENALRYADRHPVTRALQGQIAEVEKRIQAVDKRIAELPDIQQTYLRLSRNVEINNQLYVGLLNNTQQLEIAKTGSLGNLAVIDPPTRPEWPTSLSAYLILLMGSVGGFLLGALLVQVRGGHDRVVRDPETLVNEIGIPLMASVWAVSPRCSDPWATAVPWSTEHLRSAVLHALAERPNAKVLMLASASPSPGQALIAAALARRLAASGRQVLLISDHKEALVGVSSKAVGSQGLGLFGLVTGACEQRQVIQRQVQQGVDWLFHGLDQDTASDCLASDSAIGLMRSLADQYDFVVIDMASVSGLADACSFAHCTDLTLLLVQQHIARLPCVKLAAGLLMEAGSEDNRMVFLYAPGKGLGP